MESDCIHFKKTGYFSALILDYLAGDEKLSPFYTHSPNLESFATAIAERQFADEDRILLTNALRAQYAAVRKKKMDFEAVDRNIILLEQSNTYTVTTGHQLNLFTGPLYFMYKIVSTIQLATKLKKLHPEYEFVPVYWMATEDHDFEEINHFHHHQKKIEWTTDQKGAVGRFSTKGMEEVLEAFEKELADYSGNGNQLLALFRQAYLEHDTLANAHRYLVHQLFAKEGMLIVDGDDISLKKLFVPILKEELANEVSFKAVEAQSAALEKHYKIQVNPREINLFYLTEQGRHRILKENDAYFVHETSISFTEEELQAELNNHPDRFSPNVLLRPVYQECILPNLAYIGGGGELAYWFQLKGLFETLNLQLPVLLLRNSALWMDEKQHKYMQLLALSPEQLFLSEGPLLKQWVMQQAEEKVSLKVEEETFRMLYDRLAKKAAEVDETLGPHLKAVEVKHAKSMDRLQNQFIRAERKKHQEAVRRIHHLKEQLFPGNSLQERKENFTSLYLVLGETMVDHLKEAFDFPSDQFYIFRTAVQY